MEVDTPRLNIMHVTYKKKTYWKSVYICDLQEEDVLNELQSF